MFRNFGRAWSYVQLCQAIPLVCGVLITGIYYSLGNYFSVISVIGSSIILSVINIHKHRRGKRRRALRRQNTTDKEEKCHEELTRRKTCPQSPVRVPIRSARSYEVDVYCCVMYLNNSRSTLVNAGLWTQFSLYLSIAKLS